MISIRGRILTAVAVGALFCVGQAKADHSIAMPTEEKGAWYSNLLGSGCCDPCRQQMIRAWGEFLWLSPRGVDLAFAVPVDSCGTLVPVGPVAIVSTDYEPTFRLGFDVALGCNSSIGVSYMRLENHNEEAVTGQPGAALHSLVTVTPGTCADGSVQAAGAFLDVNFEIIDLDLRHRICSCDDFNLVLVVGARYSRLEQEFGSEFSVLGTTVVLSNTDFEGIGPRIGLEADMAVCHGLSAYARGYANFLVGTFESDYFQGNTFAGVQAATEFEDRRIMPVLEFEAGVAWTSCNECLRVAAGYYVATWLNSVTTAGVIDAVRSGNFNRRDDNLNDSIQFDGLTARVEVRY
jgi:hypothetical protein